MEEKVSVIVPIYNVESYLRRCLDSLVKQKHQNIEIIMVDDCSTDNSASIAKEYAEKYPRFLFIQKEVNGGLSAARNTGMKATTGEWLAFVDSDDWVTEDYISAMYEVAKKDNADVVMSSICYAYEDGSCKEMSPFSDLTTASSQGEKVALSRAYAATRLYKKSFIDATGICFPTDIRRSEDIATVVPWLTRAESISILQRPLYYYYQRAESLSNMNHKNVDVSFVPKTIERMIALSAPGFENELEYRAVSELMYGMVIIMLRAEYSRREIKEHVKKFNEEHPTWKKNPYLSRLPLGKRIFISLVQTRLLYAAKILQWGWDVLMPTIRMKKYTNVR